MYVQVPESSLRRRIQMMAVLAKATLLLKSENFPRGSAQLSSFQAEVINKTVLSFDDMHMGLSAIFRSKYLRTLGFWAS